VEKAVFEEDKDKGSVFTGEISGNVKFEGKLHG
jgi:hypothetical protein